MTSNNYLRSSSVLYWLVALLAAGIIFIGARFLVTPLTAAEDFGVPADGTRPFAYLWAKGTRDIVSGLAGVVFLWLGVGRRVLAAYIAVVALVPAGDFINVYLNMGVRSPTALMIHGATVVFMVALAALLRRESI
jgi:Domain of unknown function (DUF4267)